MKLKITQIMKITKLLYSCGKIFRDVTSTKILVILKYVEQAGPGSLIAADIFRSVLCEKNMKSIKSLDHRCLSDDLSFSIKILFPAM